MKILLSIRPEYADKIFEGSKRFEFRKVLHKNPGVSTVVVYATRPVGKVIGEFTIFRIHSEAPRKLWKLTKAASGISKEFFMEYFSGREVAFAIEVGVAKRYAQPLSLQEVMPNGYAPQSFAYLAGVHDSSEVIGPN